MSEVDDGVINDWLNTYERFGEGEDYGYGDPQEWARDYGFFIETVPAERLAEYEYVVNSAANPYSTHEDPFHVGVELFDEVCSIEVFVQFAQLSMQ